MRYNGDKWNSFEFGETGDIETGEITGYYVKPRGIEDSISEEKYRELRSELDNLISKCKTFEGTDFD